VDDPIFDPWCIGDEEWPTPSQRSSRWRSASGSAGVPASRPVPSPIVQAAGSDPAATVVPGAVTAPEASDGGGAGPTDELVDYEIPRPRSEDEGTIWFIDDPLDELSRAELIAAATPGGGDLHDLESDAAVQAASDDEEEPREPASPEAVTPDGPSRPEVPATVEGEVTSIESLLANTPADARARERGSETLTDVLDRLPDTPSASAAAFDATHPAPLPANDPFRDLVLPRLRDVGQRLSIARHGVTLDDRLADDPPSVRLRIEPRRGPFEADRERPAAVLELAPEGVDGIAARLWMDPRSRRPTEERYTGAERLSAGWVDKVLLDFVGKALA